MIQDAIKKLAQEQAIYKPQRKTINFKGKRTVEPDEAILIVAGNNYHLRHLYIAYDIIRKKPVSLPKKKYWSKQFVEQLIKKYSQEE